MVYPRFAATAAAPLLIASLSVSCALAQKAEKPLPPPVTAAQLKAAALPTHDETWWKHAVVYEIYPRSFQDSNGDGIGDLNGMTQRLDYLQKLGVDAMWIAPMFPSPQVDFGYDISDYEAVDPQYGTMADFDRLVAAAQGKGVKVMLDMVLNHTSDKHKWFTESAASRSNSKADWYVWNDGVPVDKAGVTDYQRKFAHDGMAPPNNWESLFGGSAWEWVPARKQFYYHKFYKQQPDLNWRNPAVETAMFNMMKFWLDKGVAGFRLDAVPVLFEDTQLRNEDTVVASFDAQHNALTNAQGDPILNDNRTNMLPEVHDVLRRMRTMMDSYPGNRVLVGETYLPNTAELNKWYGGTVLSKTAELHLPMDFLVGFHTEGGGPNSPNVSLDLKHLRTYLGEMETTLGDNWPLLVFDNHDNVRSWDRFSRPDQSDVQKQAIAKIIATMLYTTRATALTYYGAELGMPTTTPSRVEDVQDPIGKTGWPKEKGRDGERTPMQWTAGPQAGFSTDPKTWLPVPADYKTINVQTEQADPNSMLNWSEKLIALRRSNPALHDGGFAMLNTSDPNILSYVRTAPTGSTPVLTLMNMTAQPQTISLDMKPVDAKMTKATTLASSDPSVSGTQMLNSITLPAYASWVGSLQ